MKTKCVRCGELASSEEMREHTLDGCKAAAKTYLLLDHGLRPLPAGNSLPSWMPVMKELTRGPYEGEPRELQKLLATPVEQHWIPRWVDVIVELWAGPIFLEGMPRQLQRDQLMQTLLPEKRVQEQIEDARDEDLRAVRALLRPWIVGPVPMLIEEVAHGRA